MHNNEATTATIDRHAQALAYYLDGIEDIDRAAEGAEQFATWYAKNAEQYYDVEAAYDAYMGY